MCFGHLECPDARRIISLMNRTLLSLLTVALLAGCAPLDRQQTSLAPVKADGGYQYFRYRAFADAVYPLGESAAEKMRLEWLERWLTDNGYSSTGYEVLDREPILRNRGLLGDIYDVFYTVRVKAKP